MWTKERVDKFLSHYLEDKARAAHLRVEIEQLQADIVEAEKVLSANVDNLGAQVITGMPRGTATSDPTSQTAIRLAMDIVPPEIKEMQTELSECRNEMRERERTVFYVDTWLMALTEREKWLVMKQVISGEFWRTIMDDYAIAYQVRISQDTLSRIKAKAMQKIYAAAGVREQTG